MNNAVSHSSLLFEIGVVLVLVLLNGFFAMSELAIVSSRRARLKPIADKGHRGAQTTLRLQAEPTQFLATVQFGITLVGIVAGAYSGATLSEPLAAVIAGWPWLADYAYPIAIGIVVATITYLSLVVGELVPKRIALHHAESIAMRVSRPMALLAKIGAPVVIVLRTSTELLLRLFGISHTPQAQITEEEIKVMIAEGADAGVFMQQERHMMEGVLHLADHTIRSIMTPRPEIEWVDANDPPEEQLKSVLSAQHSRLLLCDGSVDEVLGFVHTKDLLAQMATDQRLAPRACTREVLPLHETTTVLRLLDIFRQSTTNIGLVVDEYGSVQGLVTPRDIFTAIAGEFAEDSSNTAGIVRRDDGSWSVDGGIRVSDLERAIGGKGLTGKDYSTIAGLVLHELGHLPRIGEVTEYAGYRIEVADVDGRRIDRVIVTRLRAEER